MSDDGDSFDKLNQEFSTFLRQRKKEKAFQSIFLLSEAYVAIVKQFNVNADEYLYYLEKFKTSPRSDFDLSQTEIVLYLKGMIERLERIYGKKIDASSLEIIAQEQAVREEDSVIEGDVLTGEPEPKINVVETEEQIAPSPHVEYREITMSASSPPDPKNGDGWEDFSMDQASDSLSSPPPGGDRDLNAILDTLASPSPIELKNGEHQSPSLEYAVVQPLKAFGFKKPIPKYLPKPKK